MSFTLLPEKRNKRNSFINNQQNKAHDSALKL